MSTSEPLDQGLARVRSPKHIGHMNRHSLKPIVSTALMAIAAVMVWLFWIGDRCLATHISNHWAEKNPPVIAPTTATGSSDYVEVEDPYGIGTCHYQNTGAGEVLNVTAFAIVAFAIGWLTARRIQHRPLITSAAIVSLAMLIVLLLQYSVRWEDIQAMRSAGSPEFRRVHLLAVLVFFLVASGIAMFGAWITLRFTRRA
jgi:hypothetical protein